MTLVWVFAHSFCYILYYLLCCIAFPGYKKELAMDEGETESLLGGSSSGAKSNKKAHPIDGNS
jgi:hypothetical protein